ncbi:Prefoldin [Rhizodiscina lignyota]|uniref:Prefoldin n=1 Tax=Rhizodiscina lignyota TaxID=1504668 RepID=A0A9P4I8C1_9PEZI|nr:Prefoldin [Rhizodiscina lignyota]
MSIPNEALQKLLLELEQSAAQSQQQISAVKQQIALKGRESRMLQLTKGEVESLPKDTKVYEGVGKMFVMTPADEVKQRLSTEDSELKSDVSSLEKRLQYLETTFKNSRQNLDKVLKAGGG